MGAMTTANPWNNTNVTTTGSPIVARSTTMEMVTKVAQCTVLVLTALSNFMLILSLKIRQSGGLKLVDKLMLNTVVCNVLLVVISIPIEFFASHIHNYPFANFVCTLVSPLSTYLLNCSVFTYVVIAIER